MTKIKPEPCEGEAVWIDGHPTGFRAEEWFIALTTYGDRVVLKALPENYSYDFKTADETYIKAGRIKQWMPFPDSEFTHPAAPSADKLREGVWGWLFIDDDGLEWSANDPRLSGENQYAENVRPASMEDALEHLIADIFQPSPPSLPEQSSRAAEAMAGVADSAARREWERRVSVAKDQLADRVRQALASLKAEGA